MSETPEDLHYTSSHEWVRVLEDGSVTVGITDHAQALLGDLVFAEVPEEGQHYAAGNACAVVESVKAASDIYCPVSGTVSEVNAALADAPELINQEPYGDGWIMTIQPDDSGDIGALLSASDYAESLEEE